MHHEIKKATLTIQLVPESQTINNERIKKEVAKSLTCDWLLKIQNITIEE
jgi:translation elongation factor EF-1beta